MILIGLTGSIGMGKTTTARLFAEMGVPVWSADSAVHVLYAKGGAAVAPVRAMFPSAVVAGAVDRTRLSALLREEPEALARLEAVVHPLVGHARTEFLDRARASGRDVAVIDVPLLFETGADAMADVIVVASAPEHVQRERVLARDGMDPDKFQALLARQVPDAEKRARADFVVDTSRGIEDAGVQVGRILQAVTGKGHPPRPATLDGGFEPPQD